MRLAACLLAANLLAPLGAEAAPCARPAERAAFDVTALKSRLMVAALTCGAQDNYNAFVRRYRGELLRHERGLAGWFARRGRRAQDSYVTDLANMQAERSAAAPADCIAEFGLFDRVMQSGPGDLPALAAELALARPMADCPTPARATRLAAIPPAR